MNNRQRKLIGCESTHTWMRTHTERILIYLMYQVKNCITDSIQLWLQNKPRLWQNNSNRHLINHIVSLTLSQKLLSWLMDPLIPFYSCWHLQKWKEADASQYRTFSIKWLLLLYETVMDKQDTQLLWTSESATLTSATWLNAAGALELRFEKAAGNETLQQQKSLFDERSAWGEQRSPGLKVTGRKAEVASLCRLTSTRTIWCNLTTSANITTPTGGKNKHRSQTP